MVRVLRICIGVLVIFDEDVADFHWFIELSDFESFEYLEFDIFFLQGLNFMRKYLHSDLVFQWFDSTNERLCLGHFVVDPS